MNNSRELIKFAVEQVNNKYIDNKQKINNELNEALKNKYEKVGKDEDKFIEILRYNIIFYKSIIKKLESIIEMWIQNDMISGSISIDKSIDNITNSSRQYVKKAMKNGIAYLNEKDKKIFYSYDKSSGIKRIEKVENDYRILNLYKDILAMVINIISSDVEKYSPILEMSTESVKIDFMNEIFKIINEILFSEDNTVVDFKDEALVDDEDIEGCDINDEEKIQSFKKYVSMISTPEILVKINDIFRKSVELEKIDEEDAYGFSGDYKDYVSCVVLLMDYISQESRMCFANAFRLLVTGRVSLVQFEEIIDKLIRDMTFIDKKNWLTCQKIVKSDFNMENNNFFGIKTQTTNNDNLVLSESIKLLGRVGDDETIVSYLDGTIDPEFDYVEEEEHFSNKIKSKIDLFLGKFKNENSLDDDEEYYDDEYEEEYEDEEIYEEDEEYYDYEYSEEDEDKKDSLKSRLKNVFSKNKNKSDNEFDEYDRDDEFDNEKDTEVFIGDEEIQSPDALAILMMREKSKRKENKYIEKEFDELRDERHLTEQISKKGLSAFKCDSDIVLDENDSDYEKSNYISSNKNLFDQTIGGGFSIYDSMDESNPDEDDSRLEDKDEINKYNEKENNIFNPILGHTQRLNLKALLDQNENVSEVNYQIEDINKEENKNLYKEVDIEDSKKYIEEKIKNSKKNDDHHKTADEKKNNINEDIHEKEKISEKIEIVKEDLDTKKSEALPFEELETLKAMRRAKVESEENSNKSIEKPNKSIEKPNKNVEKRASSKQIPSEDLSKNDDTKVNLKVDLDKTIMVDSKAISNLAKKQKEQKKIKAEFKKDEDTPKVEKKESSFKLGLEKIKSLKDSKKIKIENTDNGQLHESKIEDLVVDTDEATLFPKKEVLRDLVIVVVVVVTIFVSYVYIVNSFKVPTVEETNKNTEEAQVATQSNNNEKKNSTTEITKKTEAEKEKDEIESKASEKDRLAEQYKSGKGEYFTIYVGATKSKSAADSVANNYANRGITAKVVRNNGYYMLRKGEYTDYNSAYNESTKLTAKGIQNYISSQNKYYDLKIEAYEMRIPNLSKEQLKTDYDDLRNQISSTGKNSSYVKNLDEIYEEAIKNKQ
ncbi:SPOR domain-containing protein [Peptostreptococcus faecalis]|nr:SPOR domain-containing protein [Peptostreptococcus faecalis]